MLKHLTIILLILFSTTVFAQNDIPQHYVNQGIKNNLTLKQEQFSLEKSMQALSEARGMFLPAVSIEARYSRAGGGRLIEFPVGDLMNPVYSTLNQYLESFGQVPSFPTNLQNEHIPFLREEEHDTKIRIRQSVFQPAIYYNYKIKSKLNEVQQAKLSIFKRQLTADIKTAYLKYLIAARGVELCNRTMLLVKENLWVSEKLFQNGKATEEVVFRAKAEISELEQKQAEVEKNRKLAAAYLNFLINRPLESSIEIVDDSLLNFNHELNLGQAQAQALQNREEFQQLKSAIGAAKSSVGLTSSSFLPGVIGVFDYGFQGEEYSFAEKDDYWMASLVLQWNLFNGFKDKSKRNQAMLDKNKLETQLLELEQQIKLQVQEAYSNLIVAGKVITSANERLNSARKSFRIVNKKYEQGMTPQIEYLNARTSFTNAEANQIIARYDYGIKWAEFERVVATNWR